MASVFSVVTLFFISTDLLFCWKKTTPRAESSFVLCKDERQVLIKRHSFQEKTKKGTTDYRHEYYGGISEKPPSA